MKDAVRLSPHAVMFKFKTKEIGYLKTDAGKLWYPKSKTMTFKPVQFHFHSGVWHVHNKNMGSENTYNGRHYPLELHIVHLNQMKDKTTLK